MHIVSTSEVVRPEATDAAKRGAESVVAKEAPRFEWENAHDLMLANIPPLQWLVRGLITEESMGAIAGEPKTSKTWALLELAIAVATGTKAFGEFQTGPKKPVGLFLAEDHRKSVRKRLYALCAGRGLTGNAAAEACAQIFIVCRKSMTIPTDSEAFIASLPEGIEFGLVGFDPLRDVHESEENAGTEMRPVMRALREIRDRTGACVVFTHHSAKMTKEVGERRAGQRMRGSSVVHGAIDFGLYMGLEDGSGLDNTEWRNECTVEVKAGRGAGVFTLTLNVSDDSNGEATKATWTHSSGKDRKPLPGAPRGDGDRGGDGKALRKSRTRTHDDGATEFLDPTDYVEVGRQ